LEDKHGKESKVEFFDKKTFLDTVNVWIQNRYRVELLEQKSRGAAYGNLINSSCSNFFLGNCKAPVSNALFRFVVRGRNDTLWTKVKMAFYYPEDKEDIYCNVALIIRMWKVYSTY
jgi:hypothetical protein